MLKQIVFASSIGDFKNFFPEKCYLSILTKNGSVKLLINNKLLG